MRNQWRQIMPGVFEGVPLVLPKATVIDEEPTLVEKLSNIPFDTKKTHTLDTWQRKGNESWWDEVVKYSKGEYKHPFLTFLGMVGTGKTRLAWTIAWEWMRAGHPVLYYQAEELLDALREGYSTWEKGDPNGYSTILKHTEVVKLLILDDLGTEHGTPWAKSKMNQVINYRYVEQKPLIATTNLTLDQLPERIADRLSEGTLIQLMGESFRTKRR